MVATGEPVGDREGELGIAVVNGVATGCGVGVGVGVEVGKLRLHDQSSNLAIPL
jgi:hypothetical protein